MNKKIKLSILTTILSTGLIAGGYSALKKDVVLIVDGKEMQIATFKKNVEEFLEEQNVEYDSNDIISKSLDEKLTDDMVIEVIDVVIETIREAKNVDFETKIVDDENLDKGITKVAQEGVNGTNELVYTVTYHNGEQIDKTFVEEVVLQQPQEKIIKNGTKVEVKVASSRGESTRKQTTTKTETTTTKNSDGHMKVVATAYFGDGVTSTGTTPKWGTIAVDPSVIPYGTKVYIPQFDMTFIAEDTGSAIKGNKIDIFMTDESKVYEWGRQTIDIYIVG
jgi:3D (Asp-Asp-Asp) domain-containing protein